MNNKNQLVIKKHRKNQRRLKRLRREQETKPHGIETSASKTPANKSS